MAAKKERGRLPIGYFDPVHQDLSRDEPYCEHWNVGGGGILDHGRVAGPITGGGFDAAPPQHRLHRLRIGSAGERFYHPPQQPQPP
jgi:hypothetical protein